MITMGKSIRQIGLKLFIPASHVAVDDDHLPLPWQWHCGSAFPALTGLCPGLQIKLAVSEKLYPEALYLPFGTSGKLFDEQSGKYHL